MSAASIAMGRFVAIMSPRYQARRRSAKGVEGRFRQWGACPIRSQGDATRMMS